MSDARRRRALVTGASSGIGRSMALRLAREGYDVVLVARRRGLLEELARAIEGVVPARGGSKPAAVEVVAVDLCDREAPARIAEAVGPDGVEVLINNAGGGWIGPFDEAPLARQLEVVDLNVRALVELTHRLLPAMKARRSGRIVQIASVAGFLPGPMASVYYASKAFVVSHSEALRHELAGTGVTMTLVCPGPVATEFQRSSGVRGNVGDRVAMSADDVAEAAIDGMLRGRFLVVPGASNAALVALSRVLPTRVLASLVGKMQERRLRDGA